MFCGECGKKIDKDAIFCGECGAPVPKSEKKKSDSVESTTNSSSTVRNKPPMSKKKKILIGVILVALVCLFGGYKLLESYYSPKNVAKEYVDALFNKDSNKLYKYLNLSGDTTFVSKDAFKDYIKESYDIEIKNYKIGDVTYHSGGLSASVEVHYVEEGESEEETDTLTLTKEKGKKLFFFDSWTVNNEMGLVLEDYEIIVPKGSSVELAGKALEEKYLDEKASDDDTDVYEIPQIFMLDVPLKTTLENGIIIEEEIRPSSYDSSYTVELSLDSLSDSAKEEYQTKMKDSLTTIYSSLMEKKTFADIQNTISNSEFDLTDLEEEYSDTLEDLTDSSNTLKSIEFTTINLTSIEFNEDDKNVIDVRAKINYNYTVEYTSYSDEVLTKSNKDYSYFTLSYTYRDGNYYLVDIDGLVSYFSRY